MGSVNSVGWPETRLRFVSDSAQIYTDNNVRVRSIEARVNELQKKLNEVGTAGTPGGRQTENSRCPSTRKLPLLGVTCADLYRETKIQETMYEVTDAAI